MASPAYQIESTATSINLWALSATELVDAFRKKTLSPVEVTAAVLKCIEALNPVFNAFNLVSENALTDAKAEARWLGRASLCVVAQRAPSVS
jgi:Asp-tRNA(Asn)/Glu-tRNA(Gln) amidotransferase A subunit family amidase